MSSTTDSSVLLKEDKSLPKSQKSSQYHLKKSLSTENQKLNLMKGMDVPFIKKTVRSMLIIRTNNNQIMKRKISPQLISMNWSLPVINTIFLVSMRSTFLQKTNPKRKTRKNKSVQFKQSGRYVHQKTKIKKTSPIELQAKTHSVTTVVESMTHKTCRKSKVRSKSWFKETKEIDKLKNKSKDNANKFSKLSKDKTVFLWCKNTNRTSWKSKRTLSKATKIRYGKLQPLPAQSIWLLEEAYLRLHKLKVQKMNLLSVITAIKPVSSEVTVTIVKLRGCEEESKRQNWPFRPLIRKKGGEAKWCSPFSINRKCSHPLLENINLLRNRSPVITQSESLDLNFSYFCLITFKFKVMLDFYWRLFISITEN